VVEAQVREILSTGDITLKLNRAAGRDFTISDLRRDFDAVLIAVGAHRSRDLTIPGVNLDGVYKASIFCSMSISGTVSPSAKRFWSSVAATWPWMWRAPLHAKCCVSMPGRGEL